MTICTDNHFLSGGPLVSVTTIYAVNDSLVIAGVGKDANCVDHGFVAYFVEAPEPDSRTILAVGASLVEAGYTGLNVEREL